MFFFLAFYRIFRDFTGNVYGIFRSDLSNNNGSDNQQNNHAGFFRSDLSNNNGSDNQQNNHQYIR